MELRPRQEIFVSKCVSALNKHGNTLGVAPTGAGKTIMGAFILDRLLKSDAKKILVLQHRTELKEQNGTKFSIATKNKYSTSYVQGAKKDFSGDVVFGMIQTIARNLETLPKFDACWIDEVHRARSKQYLETLEKLKELNPNVKIFGVTATPNRGDKKGLGVVFSNVADVISINELIKEGHLVPPRTYSLDMGQITDLMGVQKTSTGEYDQEEVADILNQIEITKGVIKYWKEIAHDRKTIAFCATVKYAKTLQIYFEEAGIKTSLVYGELGRKDRKQEIWNYEHGNAQIMFNVAVFTEGYDYPPTSCVMLLRQSSYHGTMVQMIGRGLRIVNPEEYPEHKNKVDCVVLDFGISTTIHGSLKSRVELEDRNVEETDEDEEELEEKMCPECMGIIPIKSEICPLCGFSEEKKLKIIKEELKLPIDFNLIEVNLLDKSSFMYESFYDGKVWVASGFNNTAFIVNDKDGNWYVFVKKEKQKTKLIKTETRQRCFSIANDWMDENEKNTKAKKGKAWQKRPPTETQLFHLKKYTRKRKMTRYRALCMLQLVWNEKNIARIIRER